MNSRKGGGKTFSAAAAGGGNPLPNGKGIEESTIGTGSPKADQLSRDMADISMDTQEGGWEVYAKKTRSRSGASAGAAAKSWGSSNSATKAWGRSEGGPRQGWGTIGGAGRTSGNNWAQTTDSRRPVGRGISKPQPLNKAWESQYMAPPPVIPPPLQHGWQWAARGGSSGSQPKREEIPQDGTVGRYNSETGTEHPQVDDGSDENELVEDSDDDFSDDYDSDESQKSHETRKKNRWFKGFFEELDKLSVEELNEQTRQWHCPACHNGPGAIEWYKGLQPLMTHAKTKGATRVKLHRDFAVLLEEELHRRGTSVVPAGEAFGKWKGLRETTTDHLIVWPPMVVIMNTLLQKDENDKWIGMGNQELLEYFNSYAAVKARHSYGPHGHRGMSVLIFEGTAMGYLEAERLHKHFAEQGTDREAWERRRVLFYPGGKRQLYGYLASKEDMETFNQHSQGKSRLKYDTRSYQEMVVIPMKQMSEDNQQLIWLKNKVVKQEQWSKTLEETCGVMSQKLRESREENRIVRLRTKIQHEENKVEMDYLEQFFKEQMDKVHNAIEEKESTFEKLLQEERTKAKQSVVDSGTSEDRRLRKEEIARFIDSQVKEVKEFEAEREKLIRSHEEKKVELRRKYIAEEVELEKEFDAALTKLMEKYTPSSFEASSSSS
ncbi:protein SUPPRESSOR OF GENE SILENCING 3 homolog [Phoenix dactylifera]|uniref:Protein SUPPRESSOR OF GENE SILENCING 3 homolog n=1 Tax=Phoenix dactylifera TaxID=42345 RepID=A0A8B7CAP4_PHODC|nr:protein SUPPRESSOR OF GENE SILENCING 3 homolog [Phoenix dactylifera]XP_008795271.1 protein SUPPRESSOR OF GENE SILENCING 3 homolog [Phoenix dactylifera]XP_038986729.1 protein SUPPRESSOR OF GENE SILENCING 3 homolog [Phoenix dactylifera]